LSAFCDRCGASVDTGDHDRCAAGRVLEPPRYCADCGRRMVVQVTPTGWTARCSRHGERRSPAGEGVTRSPAGEGVTAAEVSWRSSWEDDLQDDDHATLGALLARCFPRSFTPFGPGRSWSSARPELRLVGSVEGRPVAHLAVVRRFLQVSDVAVLVGDVGLVAVDPAVQGRALGAALLTRCRAALAELDLPFGYLTCGEHVAGFYASAGWVRVPGPTRMVRADGRVQVYGGVSMVLPVGRGIDTWPGGRVDRNGWEV